MLRQALISVTAWVMVFATWSPLAAQEDRLMSSREARANQLVMEVQRLRGLPPAPLQAEVPVAHGTLLFRFLPNSDRLTVSILVAHDPSWNRLSEQFAANYRRARAALSDPAIGGLFDTGGGGWMFEERTGKTYLYAAFPLDAPASAVNARINSMERVAPAWEMRWLTEVARIAHGEHPPPAQPVTLEEDPYAGQL